MEKKALVYFQSGGPTTVINCSFYGVIKEALRHEELGGIYGALHGVEGLIGDDLVDLRQEDPHEIELLKQTPGAALGSTRHILPKFGDPDFDKILATIKRRNIGYILVNGGNDSMDTCYKLSRFFAMTNCDIRVIGIPKTVDNDLVLTDHSLGFASAAKHIINFTKMAVIDNQAYKKGKVLLIEIMGRNAGWLTASVDVLPEGERPDLIYIPEMKWDEGKFLQDVQRIYERKGNVVVALSEGLPVTRRNGADIDSFGHVQLEGVSVSLSQSIKKNLGYGTRVMELSLPQRADPVLASESEKKEAVAVSEFAVKAVLAGKTGYMVCIRRESNNPYKSSFFLGDVGLVANQEKKVPLEWVIDSTRLSEGFRQYILPLIAGESRIEWGDGVFQSAHLRLTKVF
ncbi:MAG: diphosphate--fructose-6-phosphate 1-phosphotransferase [Bacilli bacterium]|jgi:6-phosphofructokinase 1|nr:diphosphate--fructose-6-phosphate 1-phosphotransferase [Bacilli bacterium]